MTIATVSPGSTNPMKKVEVTYTRKLLIEFGSISSSSLVWINLYPFKRYFTLTLWTEGKEQSASSF